jgi:hypothetical protein
MEEKIVEVKGKQYKLAFPTVGQYYNMEATKQALGKGFYNALLGNQTRTAQEALDMIDIEATITVLMPDLVDDLKVKRFKDLGLKDYVEVKKLYETEIVPFLREAMDILRSI